MSMTELSSSELEQVFANALKMHQSGNLDQAESLYGQVIAAEPRHFDALNLLGVIALQTNRAERAAELLGRAIAVSDKVADVHNNMGEVHRRLGRADSALTHFERATEIEPTFTAARLNLARMLILANRQDEALAQFRKVLESEPTNVQAKSAIADWLYLNGQLNEAAANYQETIIAAPTFVSAQVNLASIKLAQGDFATALTIAMRLLQKETLPQARLLFADSLAELRPVPNQPEIRRFLTAAIRETWARPSRLSAAASTLAKTNVVIANLLASIKAPNAKELDAGALLAPQSIAALANDGLLIAHLETMEIADVELERALTVLRFLILNLAAAENAPIGPEHIQFCAALARQCYINNYVFTTSQIEIDLVAQLKTALTQSIANGKPLRPLMIIAFAAYRPLRDIAGAEALANASLPSPIQGLVQQQVIEPATEQKLAAALPALTPIDDETSLAVRQQYEESPYPTWGTVEPVIASSFDERMQRMFPLTYVPIAKANPGILIAGCGTGRQSIEAALSFPDAKLLAIDLSLASLGYAARKTQEMGIRNLEYAHADILRLSDISTDYDVIESSGVLHHLRDPLQGWDALLSRLRPGGAMRIGLYSKSARHNVNVARDFVQKGGYQSTPEGIRACRQTLVASKDPALQWMTYSTDFFTTSSCRDLLFHVQEHQFTLPEIKTYLARKNLTLLGFDSLPAAFFTDYRAKFPGDTAMTNLDHWHSFEEKHPQMFGGMYQFWIQKPR